jgi:hypothetical protein
MKYLKKDQTEEIKVNKEVDFNKNGTQVSSTKEKVFAKIVESEKNNNYLIKTYNNEIYDPMGLNSNRERFLQTKLKRVSKDTFDFYLIYLQTNNSIYLTRANRRFINE